MQKLLLLLFISLGFIGNSYAAQPYLKEIRYCKEGFIKSSDETRCVKIGGEPSTIWYENGQKKSEAHFKDGKWHGKWTIWYENGQKESEGHFKDSKRHGKWTYWYENGQIKSEGNYKDDERDGNWTGWDENGQIDYVENYNIVAN